MLMGKVLDRGFRTSFWTVRNQGRGEDSRFQSIGCDTRVTIPECPPCALHCANGNNNHIH